MVRSFYMAGNSQSILFRQRYQKIAAATESDVTIIDTGHTGLRGRLGIAAACLQIIVASLVSRRPVRMILHGAYSPVLWIAALLPRVQTTAILQGSELTVDFQGLRASIIRLLLLRSGLVVCRSKAQLDEVERLCGVSADKCLIVQWGMDDKLFTMTRADRREVTRIISPRATQKEYNIPAVFGAIRRLKEEGHEIHFTYVKFNSHFDVEDAGVVDVQLSEPQQDIFWEALCSSDICVSVPQYDGFSNTIVEALALGVFPIFSDLPTYSELKEDDHIGRPVALTGKEDVDAERIYSALHKTIVEIDTVRSGAGRRRQFARSHSAGIGLARLFDHLR